MANLNPHDVLERLPEATLVVDPFCNKIFYANGAAVALLGKEAQQILALPASTLFKKNLTELISFTEQVIDKKWGVIDELVITDASDHPITLEITASVMDASERPQLCICLRDKDVFQAWRVSTNAQRYHRYGLLEWQRIHQVFQTIERENQLILSAAGEGIYGIDAEGCATFVNPAAERLLGWDAEQLIGKNIHAAIHHSHADGSDYCVQQCPIYLAFKDGTIHQVEDEVFWTKSGKPIAVEYTSTPILDNGHLVGAVVIFRDVSDRKNAEVQLRNALTEVEHLRQKLELENAYLQEEISEGYNFHHIVGKSPVVQQIINQIQLVAPTCATVLITGESGTGKELIARAIHSASDRNNRALVRVNCAAIPRDLFESEFFGHIKGAFSGAIADRVGRFELADGGTLFLDEVGEIPLELQGKLLRALQDNEFERVGESNTRKVDVRVIAATNRNLKQLVAGAKFREDLYFRLNVFPLRSAPLRERRSDIPLLISHFLKKICKRFSKADLTISVRQVRQLQNYAWPGNVRELENLLERQVIVSRGDKLILDDLSVSINNEPEWLGDSDDVMTEVDCRSLQVKTIVNALKKSHGKIYGANGAAQILGIKPTTLASRIKKYQIDRTALAGLRSQ